MPIVISDPVSMTASSDSRDALHLGQDQLAVLAPGDDDDVARVVFGRLGGVLDLDQALVEIEHQAVLGERVDADQPVAPDIRFPERRKLANW